MNREQDLETSDMLYRLADVRQNILSEYFILFNLNIENFLLFIYCSIIFLRKRMLQNHYFL